MTYTHDFPVDLHESSPPAEVFNYYYIAACAISVSTRERFIVVVTCQNPSVREQGDGGRGASQSASRPVRYGRRRRERQLYRSFTQYMYTVQVTSPGITMLYGHKEPHIKYIPTYTRRHTCNGFQFKVCRSTICWSRLMDIFLDNFFSICCTQKDFRTIRVFPTLRNITPRKHRWTASHRFQLELALIRICILQNALPTTNCILTRQKCSAFELVKR